MAEAAPTEAIAGLRWFRAGHREERGNIFSKLDWPGASDADHLQGGWPLLRYRRPDGAEAFLPMMEGTWEPARVGQGSPHLLGNPAD